MKKQNKMKTIKQPIKQPIKKAIKRGNGTGAGRMSSGDDTTRSSSKSSRGK